MKKQKLTLNDLKVKSFTTSLKAKESETIKGAASENMDPRCGASFAAKEGELVCGGGHFSAWETCPINCNEPPPTAGCSGRPDCPRPIGPTYAGIPIYDDLTGLGYVLVKPKSC